MDTRRRRHLPTPKRCGLCALRPDEPIVAVIVGEIEPNAQRLGQEISRLDVYRAGPAIDAFLIDIDPAEKAGPPRYRLLELRIQFVAGLLVDIAVATQQQVVETRRESPETRVVP